MNVTKSFLLILTSAILAASLLSLLMPRTGHLEEAAPPPSEVTTFAVEYGLNRTDVASFDATLCSRLIRFGKVAQTRGRHAEAKRFFWKAILVDPTSTLAWKHYDQAVLFTLADRVERSPGLVGLPGLADDPTKTPVKEEPEAEEGC